MVSYIYKNTNITRLRVRLYIPATYWEQPIISQMIARYNLTVNITGAKLDKNTNRQGRFDLELRGYMTDITDCLNYLESLNIKIVGKANTDGDGWHC